MNCNEAVTALVASMESGTPMTDEQREHIRTCERCRELLDSAKEFQSLLAGNGVAMPPIDPAIGAAEEELRRARRRTTVKIAVGVVVVLSVAAALTSIPLGGGLAVGESLVILGVSLLVAAMIAIPALLLVSIVRNANERGKRRFYKRLRPGRSISGVCLGIAESFGVNVSLVRLSFLLLFFFHGVGLWFYLILDLAMPVHPDDREHLLRFKLRRWWQRRMSHAEHVAE